MPVKRNVKKTIAGGAQSFDDNKKVGTQADYSSSLTVNTNTTDPVFPLKFIEIPLYAFKCGGKGEVIHEPTKKLIDEILVDYKFHSFDSSYNRGQLILCFEKR